MVDDHNHRGHHKDRCNDCASSHRPGCRFTSDDLATVIGICVSLLAVLTGVLVYVACVDLLIVLSHSGLHWWTR